MSNALTNAQDVLLGKINQICNKFGLNNIMAQLYAILYLSNRPLSLDDMVERLKISKGSASINIRALEGYRVVRQVWVKGSRKDFYEAETDISKVIKDRVRAMAEKRVFEVDDMIRSTEQALGSIVAQDTAEMEGIEIFKQRLGRLKDLYDQAKGIVELLNSDLLDNMFAENGHKTIKTG